MQAAFQQDADKAVAMISNLLLATARNHSSTLAMHDRCSGLLRFTINRLNLHWLNLRVETAR
jgi:hypothetical protein